MTTTTIDIHGIRYFTLLLFFISFVVVFFQWRDSLNALCSNGPIHRHINLKQTDLSNSQRAEAVVDRALEHHQSYTHTCTRTHVPPATKRKSNIKMIVLQNSKIYLNLELGFSLGKFLIIF